MFEKDSMNLVGNMEIMVERILDKAIASADYRKYILENNIRLTDWDVASLIYNNAQLDHEEKMEALQFVEEKTADEILKTQIKECISRYKIYLKEFCKSNGNSYYQLSTWYEGRYIEEGIYLDYEAAYLAGMEEGEGFKITKEAFACKEKKGENAGVFGSIEFHADGTMGKLGWLYGAGRDDDINDSSKTRFEGRGINLPLCFKCGDIVKIMGTETYGIVWAPCNPEEEAKMRRLAGAGDYSDFQVPVDTIFDGKKYLTVFDHEHISPAQLEYANLKEDDTRKGFLEYMEKTMYRSSLFNGTGRDKGRIPEVLARIETVWKQFPDLRLGQLLLNVCGPQDLFSIEDEELMKCFEKNIFRG